MSEILVVSPHPDDESIGCGGTIVRHVAAGDTVRVVMLTSGEAGGHGRDPVETAAIREAEARAAATVLSITDVECWREPDGRLRASTSLVERLRRYLERWSPRTIYVTHDAEVHPDHRAAARLVRAAVQRLSPGVRRPTVLMYEVWTPLQRMDEIVDISPYIEVKRMAIRAHRTQCDVVSFDDAIIGLNRYRGELHCWPDGEYAEVFARMFE